MTVYNVYIGNDRCCPGKERDREEDEEGCKPLACPQETTRAFDPTPAPKKARTCAPDKVSAGSVARPSRWDTTTRDIDDILETPKWFDTPLGQPTFEELQSRSDCDIPPDSQDPETYEEDAESTLPPLNPPLTPPPTPPPTPPTGGVQFTPDHSILGPTISATAMVESLTAKSKAESNPTQDPDGVTWLTAAKWAEGTWDGIPMNTAGKTTAEICAFIRPGSSPYVIRGLRDHFYAVNPFADNANPTVAEINDWNIEVIRHFRNLLGVTTPISANPRLYLEARWADERKYTENWDGAYPSGTPGTSTGPCWNPPGTAVDTAGGHCGAAFFPNTNDRLTHITATPYNGDFATYPELDNYTSRYAGTEGISGVNANIAWSLKLAFLLANWICDEGLTGHPGPFVGTTGARTEFGCSWWWISGPWANFRGKWR